MPISHLVPLDEALQIVEQFEARTLPSWAWTHEAHLICGLAMLARLGIDDAPAAMRQRIMDYNVAVGKVNSDTSGYHETVTLLNSALLLTNQPSTRYFLT